MSKPPLSGPERWQLFEAFLTVCTWVNVYFRWRPNLHDEGDDHLIELAVAGGASGIITNICRISGARNYGFRSFVLSILEST